MAVYIYISAAELWRKFAKPSKLFTDLLKILMKMYWCAVDESKFPFFYMLSLQSQSSESESVETTSEDTVGFIIALFVTLLSLVN